MKWWDKENQYLNISYYNFKEMGVDFGAGTDTTSVTRLEKCSECHGTGVLLKPVYSVGHLKPVNIQRPCLDCVGKGYKVYNEINRM